MTGVRVGGEAGALTRLSDDAVASLRLAFAGELAERLPVLRALCDGSLSDLDLVRRAAHSLASSAAVVGAAEAARAARSLEEQLVAGAAVEDLRAPASGVVALLGGWQP